MSFKRQERKRRLATTGSEERFRRVFRPSPVHHMCGCGGSDRRTAKKLALLWVSPSTVTMRRDYGAAGESTTAARPLGVAATPAAHWFAAGGVGAAAACA